ncbi:alkylation response protein AidB-like acyl-CoA dehydrogenase [Bradyrhizobium sp. GM6.1]
MDESLETTVDYMKMRKQFGVPICSFQSLQHRAAHVFVALEQARSMAMYATMASDIDNAAERAKAVAALKCRSRGAENSSASSRSSFIVELA